MFPILARTRWFFIYSYTAVFAVGILASLLLIRWQARKTAVSGWFDASLAALAGGLLLGRLSFLWLVRDYFQERPSELTELWRGGFTYHGTLLGALLGVAIYCWVAKRPFMRTVSLFALPLPLLHAAGWAACWLEGCGTGAPTTLSWLAADLPDQLGVFAVRYQTQLFGLIVSLLLFGLLLWRRPRHGFWRGLLLLSLAQAGISLWLETAVLTVGRWRLDTLLFLTWATFATIALLLLQFNRLPSST